MRQFLGFGDSSDGPLLINSNVADTPIDSACTGSSGSNSLSATNPSFGDGDLILIHQTQGVGGGNWELNQIQSYVAGTITTVHDLENNYVTGAQVLVLKQYSSVTVDTGFSYTVKPWDGTVGGIMSFLCSGETNVNGTLNLKGADGDVAAGRPSGGGYRGGARSQANNGNAGQGESPTGAGTATTSANGAGGGGGQTNGTNRGQGAGGGGGGHVGAGANGTQTSGASGSHTLGVGGNDLAGPADLTTMAPGGSGGGGAGESGAPSTQGGNTGGMLCIFTDTYRIGNNGRVNIDGGSTATINITGGAGPGGTGLVKCRRAILNNNKMTANPGTPGVASGLGQGGTSVNGRIRIEACSYSGNTNPTYSAPTTNPDYCNYGGQIY